MKTLKNWHYFRIINKTFGMENHHVLGKEWFCDQFAFLGGLPDGSRRPTRWFSQNSNSGENLTRLATYILDLVLDSSALILDLGRGFSPFIRILYK